MTKQEFVKLTAETAGMTQNQTETAINAALTVLASALAEGKNIKLQGFGTFEIRERKITGRDFHSGAVLPARIQKYAYFEASDALKIAINAEE